MEELLHSWPSIVADVFAYVGYWYTGQYKSWGWLANMAANLMIVFVGVLTHQYGFLGNAGFVAIGFFNFRRWRTRELATQRQPNPIVAD